MLIDDAEFCIDGSFTHCSEFLFAMALATNRNRAGFRVAGFGMLARMDVSQGAALPGWVWVKLVLWLGLGAGLALPHRRPQWAKPMLIGLPVLGAIAAVLAIYKPF